MEMRVALVQELGGIGSVEFRERPVPTPGAGQVLVRVRGAGVGPWDVAIISGAFGRPALPYTPGFEVAGVVEAVGDGVDVRPGERVWAGLGTAGGGFSEYALADADTLARMPERLSFTEAAGLVVGGGTAWDGLVDHGRLQAGETVLITAAAGGVGSVAVQVAAAVNARPLGVAGPRNRDFLRGLGAGEVFDYHARDWVQQVLAAVPGGVDVLFDAAGGQTRDQAVGAVREGGRAIFLVGAPAELGRGVVGVSLDADVNRQKLEAIGRLVEAGTLRPQVEAVLPFEQVREALERVAGRHTRGKIVLQVGSS
jgi:NADPH:quinone reductase